EPHDGAVLAAAGGQALHLLEPVAHTRPGEMDGAGETLRHQAADVVGGDAHGSGRRPGRAVLEALAATVPVRHGVDVDPALPARPPVLAGVAEHERRVG